MTAWLNQKGYRTTDSGDGSNYQAGIGCAMPVRAINSIAWLAALRVIRLPYDGDRTSTVLRVAPYIQWDHPVPATRFESSGKAKRCSCPDDFALLDNDRRIRLGLCADCLPRKTRASKYTRGMIHPAPRRSQKCVTRFRADLEDIRPIRLGFRSNE